MDEGSTIHHFLTEYESGYYGGGIKVPRAERFDKLYVEMDYCNDQLMHYYVVGSKLVNLGSIASTDGKPKRITLEIPSKKLEDAGYKDDYIQIVFTKNSTYDMTMSNVARRMPHGSLQGCRSGFSCCHLRCWSQS